MYLNSPVYKPYKEDEVLNVLLFCQGETKEALRPLIKNLGYVEYPDCFELRANQVDKATAVNKFIDAHAFETTYCFGD